MKVLLTGPNGFVGQAMLRYLASTGAEVRLLTRKPIPNFQCVPCDFLEQQIPVHTLTSIDTVFHIAGFAHDQQDPTQIEQYYRRINVDATARLAEFAVEAGVKDFVFVSSVKAGGAGMPGAKMTEESLQPPDGIYGLTKREAELRLLEIAHLSDMRVSIVRPALVYGPAVKGNLKMMLSGIKQGWFPPLPRLNNRRSMIHVDDLVRAVVLLVNRTSRDSGIYIATDGHDYSSREIYEDLCKAVGKQVPGWGVPKRFFDFIGMFSLKLRYKFDKLLGDECYSSKKLQKLGFKPVMSLQEINETHF